MIFPLKIKLLRLINWQNKIVIHLIIISVSLKKLNKIIGVQPIKLTHLKNL